MKTHFATRDFSCNTSPTCTYASRLECFQRLSRLGRLSSSIQRFFTSQSARSLDSPGISTDRLTRHTYIYARWIWSLTSLLYCFTRCFLWWWKDWWMPGVSPCVEWDGDPAGGWIVWWNTQCIVALVWNTLDLTGLDWT